MAGTPIAVGPFGTVPFGGSEVAAATLNADTGVVTVNGVTATLQIVAGTGVVTVNGVAAFLKVVAGTGVVTVNGVNASLVLVVSAGTGVITVTGVDATIIIPMPWPGSGVGRVIQDREDPDYLDFNRRYVRVSYTAIDQTSPVVRPVMDFAAAVLYAQMLTVDYSPGGDTDMTFEIARGGSPTYSLECTAVDLPDGLFSVDLAELDGIIEPGVYLARFTINYPGPDFYSYPTYPIELRVG